METRPKKVTAKHWITLGLLLIAASQPASAADAELERRLRALEERIALLEAGSSQACATGESVSTSDSGSPGSGNTLAVVRTANLKEDSEHLRLGGQRARGIEAREATTLVSTTQIENLTGVGLEQETPQEASSATRRPVYEEPMNFKADKTVGYGSQSSFLTWHGYLNFEFDDVQGKNSNFDNHEFYLAARARVNERVDFVAEFEYEHTPEKLILPIQAYVDVRLAEAATFRAGLWYTPVGMPRAYTLRGNKNRMIRQVALTHDLMFENWSDVGVSVHGQLESGFFYDVAIGNGLPGTLQPGDSFFDGIDTLQDHTEDNNDNKAVYTHFGYYSPSFLGGEFNLGFSYSAQKYDPAGEKDLSFGGFDLRFLHPSGWRIQTEYMDRSGDDNAADLATGVSADGEGWYFQLSKRILFNKPWAHYVEPVVQVDWIDLNTNRDDPTEVLTTAIGVVFSPIPGYLLKLEYDFVEEESGRDLDNNVLWLSVVVDF